ncbi:MAG: hypothetical protein V5783_06770 [Pontiella sp.]
MKRNKALLTLFAMSLMVGTPALAEKQAQCPVMGGKINPAQFADVKGKRIYVCCKGCIAKIKANPDRYLKELEAKGIVLDQTPTKKDAPEHKH